MGPCGARRQSTTCWFSVRSRVDDKELSAVRGSARKWVRKEGKKKQKQKPQQDWFCSFETN